MRLWSLHPMYLDPKGLVALWRESLLAKSVLMNLTKGYREHPQLKRFKASVEPQLAINLFLYEIYKESLKRKYKFSNLKIELSDNRNIVIPVSSGQIEYEYHHLLQKLEKRDNHYYEKLRNEQDILLNPIFKQYYGDVEEWEIIKK